MKQAGICLLGSTGTIGQNTLSVIAQHRESFNIVALSAYQSVDTLFEQCCQFQPECAVMVLPEAAKQLKTKCALAGLSVKVLSGSEALNFIVTLPHVDKVVAGIVGGAGLASTLSAARAGKQILLANKEALVMSGKLLLDMAAKQGAQLIPIDSEHNALLQCMPADYVPGTKPKFVEKLVLTASGGPFLNFDAARLQTVTPEMACRHPNWKMGKKITVDCATLMNKGLEVIEASLLFQIPVGCIDVVVHPQSIIHSLVGYQDGSFLAQLGTPDMRIPISYALAWPQRIETQCERLDLLAVSQMTFLAPDLKQFPCLALAYEAMRLGQGATTVLNASNEVAVNAFLNGRIHFTQIPEIVGEILQRYPDLPADALEAVFEADAKAREAATQLIEMERAT